jgi:hypothetical protein
MTNHEWIGEPPEARLEVFEETETRSIITLSQLLSRLHAWLHILFFSPYT